MLSVKNVSIVRVERKKFIFQNLPLDKSHFITGDSEESFLMEQDRDGRELTVQVVLIDNQTGSVVDVERFDEELKVNK